MQKVGPMRASRCLLLSLARPAADSIGGRDGQDRLVACENRGEDGRR